MSNLNNYQLQLLHQFNLIRLALIGEFKKINPAPQVFFKHLMKLEVLLMENKNKQQLGDLLKENNSNLVVMLEHLFIRKEQEQPVKKFNVKWEDEVNHFTAKREIKEQPKQQNRIKPLSSLPQNSIKQKSIKNQEVPFLAKAAIGPAQFVSASVLPKGTSVRKKFVPPFKKNQTLPKQISEKDEEQQNCQQPGFKNLEEKLVSIILSEILQKNQDVKWSSIAGLGFAKKIIHQMIVWPMLRPDIFTGLRAPPRAILLFGPPGTGKTMIGKAIASQASATFFSISASSLTSKWVGESEKLVKTLFAIARAKQPSVIFIDQIDSLLSARSEGQQQSSRRVKTQFLVELDGAKTSNNQRVLIIGATNLPQELDDAVRRRFVKRLYIPLPNHQGRYQLIRNLTSNSAFKLNEDDITLLTKKSRGFSGADLYNLCSEASMIPLRQMASIEDLRHSQVPCSQYRHFEQAFKLVRPSVNKKMLKSFEQFNQSYGSYQFQNDQLEDQKESF